MSSLVRDARPVRLGVLLTAAVALPLAAAGFGAAPVGAQPCTEVPYYGCIVIPYAPVPQPPPGIPTDITVPAWTPSLDLCTPLGGQRITVGNICI